MEMEQSMFKSFKIGEVYLFNETDSTCPCNGSIWGVFDKVAGTVVYLESSSKDLRQFRLWGSLPSEFKYARLATRSELRDYIYCLAVWECDRGPIR